MPTEAALEATVSAQDGIQQERLDHDDHESMSSKSAAELAASAAQLRQLMQKLLDSRTPQKQPQSLVHQHQPQPELNPVPDNCKKQLHQTYQVRAGVEAVEQQLQQQQQQQQQQEPENSVCFGSSFNLPTGASLTPAQQYLPLAEGNPASITAAHDAGSLVSQPQSAPNAAAEQPGQTQDGLKSLAAHAHELLQEIEAAAASSPATTVFCGSPSQQQHQQPQEPENHVEADLQRQVTLPYQQNDTAASSVLPAQHAAVPAASSLGDSLSWSTALQQYQLHTQQQQLLRQQPQVTDEHQADNWSSSYLANSPSPEGFGGMYPPYSATPAAPAQTSAPREAVEQGSTVHLQPCTAAAAAAASVAGRITAASSLRSAAPSALHADKQWRQQQQYRLTCAKDAAAAAVDTCSSVSFNVPGDAATAGPALGSSAVGGCTANGTGVADQLDSGLRLQMRALRGPLEDAMRCYTELQEVRKETSLLRATNARLTAEAQEAGTEKAYLLAERALLVAQLRNMAALLAADGTAHVGGCGGSAAAAAAAASGLNSVAWTKDSSDDGAPTVPGFLGMQLGGDITGSVAVPAEQEAEAQLEAAWRLLPPQSSLRFTCHPSQVPHDVSAVAHEFSAALGRRQQQVLQLQEQLGQQVGALQQAQQTTEILQQRLAAAGNAAELTVGHVALKLEAKWGKRVIRAEQKLATLAQEHQAADAELQQQLKQMEHACTQAQQTAERHADDKARLAGRLTASESEKEALQGQLEAHKAARRTADEQVASLQREQQQLLAALSALEGSLLDARQSTEEQRAAVARLEDALQRKNIAAVEVKQQLREARQQVQQASAEMQQLQQQLGALRNKSAVSARQLSAARTSAKEAGEALAVEQARAQQQTALLDELRAELDKARRASAAAQKAQATEAKRAAAAEAMVASLRHELSAAKEAAAEATAAAAAAEDQQHVEQTQKQQAQQQVQQLLQQVELLSQTKQKLVQQRQQLQRQLSEHEESLAEFERSLTAAVQRAESADAELAGIRREVAVWTSLHNHESCELQETRQKLAEAEIDLGVALQRVAACGMRTKLGAGSRPASACHALRAAGGTDCRGGSFLNSATGSPVPAGGAGLQQQQQHLPFEVTRQLQRQEEELFRLTGQLHQLQAQLRDAEQRFDACQRELALTQQQLAAAEDTTRWQQQQQQQVAQQHQQQQGPEMQPHDDGSKVQQLQQQVQHLQEALTDANSRVAELTSVLAAANSKLVEQQRHHHVEVRKLREQLAAAEAATIQAQQQRLGQHWARPGRPQQQSKEQLQQLGADDLLFPQPQGSSSDDDSSSSDSDAASDHQSSDADNAAADLAATAVTEPGPVDQQTSTQRQKRQQDMHAGDRPPQVCSMGSTGAKVAAGHAAVVAKQLAEAAAAYVAAAAEAADKLNNGVGVLHQASRCAAASDAAADSCSATACQAQPKQATALIACDAGSESNSSCSSSRRGRRDSGGSSTRNRTGRGVHITAHQACTSVNASSLAAADDEPQPKQQLQGEQLWEQKLQQRLLHVEQQLLQQRQQLIEPQRQASQQALPGSRNAVHGLQGAVARQACHVAPSGRDAQSCGNADTQVAYAAVNAAAVPAALARVGYGATVGLCSAAIPRQQQQPRNCEPVASCGTIGDETSSQGWEVASSSCDYEGALAAAAAALQAAS